MSRRDYDLSGPNPVALALIAAAIAIVWFFAGVASGWWIWA